MAKTNKTTECGCGAMVEQERKSSVSFHFVDPDELSDVMGDLELEEEVTLTVKGKITSLDISRNRNYPHASLSLEDITVDGITLKDKKQKEEMKEIEKG